MSCWGLSYLERADAEYYASTSPSIYANFHSILAGDWCGVQGPIGGITATMLAFSPGELSTIAGPLYDPLRMGIPSLAPATSQFNIADLPCPPQSVMVMLRQSVRHESGLLT